MLKEMTEEDKYQKCLEDLGLLLLNTSAIFQNIERDQRRSTGFTSSQSYIITILLHRDQITNEEICRIMSLEKSSVSRMVKILVRDGILKKTRSFDDKRMSAISLTEKGRKKAQTIFQSRKDYYRKIISHLPKGHVREVMNSAKVMFDALESSLTELR